MVTCPKESTSLKCATMRFAITNSEIAAPVSTLNLSTIRNFTAERFAKFAWNTEILQGFKWEFGSADFRFGEAATY